MISSPRIWRGIKAEAAFAKYCYFARSKSSSLKRTKKSAESTATKKSLSFREVLSSVNIKDNVPSTSKPPDGISSQEAGKLTFSHLNAVYFLKPNLLFQL